MKKRMVEATLAKPVTGHFSSDPLNKSTVLPSIKHLSRLVKKDFYTNWAVAVSIK
jgi:hypothetical protein